MLRYCAHLFENNAARTTACDWPDCVTDAALLQTDPVTGYHVEFSLPDVPGTPSEMLQQLVAEARSLIRAVHDHCQVTVNVVWRLRQQRQPTADIWRFLSPLLTEIDCFDVTNYVTDAESLDRASFLRHLVALLPNARPLAALSILLFDLSPIFDLDTGQAMTTIGAFSGLTKLHLACVCGQVDFQPLAPLSVLRDLALQSPLWASSCEGVLRSSKGTLRRLRLDALS